ncbi:transglutaminase family protein [Alteromonas gilva]|uniref:Transglutaminase family protein n=1 Tax=Alteromonas gilva TaxID=2987522 RepID=A0ABT5L5V5_9ALTE|nr:transglutaminase family protein [Alteromonas gilva]MDC8832443.1 transglutaminase family protein [Alteromonas gilva]
MRRLQINHITTYQFSGAVELTPHTLRLRPREGHDQHIESSQLIITPPAELHWQRDAEENTIAVASFTQATQKLVINSTITIQKFDIEPHNFLVAEHAVDYPFAYTTEEAIALTPYTQIQSPTDKDDLKRWLADIWQPAEQIQTFALLLRLNQKIYQSFDYIKREEEGVQPPGITLTSQAGSCRDLANLMMLAARKLGFASRFVSGYVHTGEDNIQEGSTHAWTEIFIPGAGWKGFDPTFGNLAGSSHIAVSVSRRAELTPPISGGFYGSPGTTMEVDVQVNEIM